MRFLHLWPMFLFSQVHCISIWFASKKTIICRWTTNKKCKIYHMYNQNVNTCIYTTNYHWLLCTAFSFYRLTTQERTDYVITTFRASSMPFFYKSKPQKRKHSRKKHQSKTQLYRYININPLFNANKLIQNFPTTRNYTHTHTQTHLFH